MVNRDELTLYFRNITRQAGVLQPLSQQRDHFAVGTAALTRIFEQHHAFKRVADDAGLLAYVFVTPVTSTADNDAAARRALAAVLSISRKGTDGRGANRGR